jgi:L-threonylcarbamoyladenylate synthase
MDVRFLDQDVAAALRALAEGLVIGVPTDTVYGLAVDPSREGATQRLFALKGRPEDTELPVLVDGIPQAEELSESGFSSSARTLATGWWPGALTLVVRRRQGVDWPLGGTGKTIGLRCPRHDGIRLLCGLAGPLAVTSANRHGEVPLTTAAAVRDAFGAGVALVLDGGTCAGIASTVVDLTGDQPRCLREGGVPWRDLKDVLGIGEDRTRREER